VLQRVAVYCRVCRRPLPRALLKCLIRSFDVVLYVAACVAVCCSVLQCVAACCSVLQSVFTAFIQGSLEVCVSSGLLMWCCVLHSLLQCVAECVAEFVVVDVTPWCCVLQRLLQSVADCVALCCSMCCGVCCGVLQYVVDCVAAV